MMMHKNRDGSNLNADQDVDDFTIPASSSEEVIGFLLALPHEYDDYHSLYIIPGIV